MKVREGPPRDARSIIAACVTATNAGGMTATAPTSIQSIVGSHTGSDLCSHQPGCAGDMRIDTLTSG